ncbi:hypothetical protein NDU88_000491 [Pleurodeles waltl]|uniref:Uncharacterized protein n=1 Tax=Pleurodeles waltl TaxID=8319 RepID=A0AAV7V589_PLEWA|nr:hypothetical protein NDU88_000491 [Pleurodeles waltl]
MKCAQGPQGTSLTNMSPVEQPDAVRPYTQAKESDAVCPCTPEDPDAVHPFNPEDPDAVWPYTPAEDPDAVRPYTPSEDPDEVCHWTTWDLLHQQHVPSRSA